MHRQRFISNTVFLVLTSLVAQIVNLFVLPLFIENLGEEMYGIFILSGILLGYLNLLDFGFTQGMTRYIARAHAEKDPVKLNQFIAAGFWFLTVIGIIAAGLIYFGRFAIVDFFNVTEANRPMAVNLLAVTAFFSLIQWPARLPGTIMHATLHIKQISIWDAIQSVLTSVAMLILVYYSVDVVSIRIATGFIGIIALLPKLLLVRRYVPKASLRPLMFHPSTIKEMSSFSLGMFYASVLGMISSQIDYAIIGKMVGVSAIIYYTVSCKLYRFTQKYTQTVLGAMLPTIFSLDTDKDRHRLQTLLEEGVRYRALLITPLAYTGIVISPSFIRIWLGKEFASSCAFWSQLLLTVFLFNFFGIAGMIARGIGKLKFINTIISIGAVGNLMISIMLVPRFGFAGPLIGTVIANFLLNGLLTFPIICRMCRLKWGKTYFLGIKIILSNLPIVFFSHILLSNYPPSNWVPLIAISMLLIFLLYGLLFVLFIDVDRTKDLRLVFKSSGLEKLPVFKNMMDAGLVIHGTLRHCLRLQ